MSLHEAVLRDVSLVTTSSKTYSRLCVIEQTLQKSITCRRLPVSDEKYFFYFDDNNGCLEKLCWKIDYQKTAFLISFF